MSPLNCVCLLNCVDVKSLQSHHRFYVTFQCVELPQSTRW